jgi:Agrobacterium tumefaciens protein Atu4866
MERALFIHRILTPIVVLIIGCVNTEKRTMQEMITIEETKDYIGMWVTKDGYIRHELLSNNRYDEARGNRKSAYQGSYKVTGNHIDYKDDTGFTADGEFKDGILYHAGMILYKEKK